MQILSTNKHTKPINIQQKISNLYPANFINKFETKSTNMKFFINTLAVLLVVACVHGAATESKEAKEAAPAEGTIKIYKRLIPADVLRGR